MELRCRPHCPGALPHKRRATMESAMTADSADVDDGQLVLRMIALPAIDAPSHLPIGNTRRAWRGGRRDDPLLASSAPNRRGNHLANSDAALLMICARDAPEDRAGLDDANARERCALCRISTPAPQWPRRSSRSDLQIHQDPCFGNRLIYSMFSTVMACQMMAFPVCAAAHNLYVFDGELRIFGNDEDNCFWQQ